MSYMGCLCLYHCFETNLVSHTPAYLGIIFWIEEHLRSNVVSGANHSFRARFSQFIFGIAEITELDQRLFGDGFVDQRVLKLEVPEDDRCVV